MWKCHLVLWGCTFPAHLRSLACDAAQSSRDLCLVQVCMPPKRRKQSGIRADGTRWTSDASGVVSYKTCGASVWTKFRLKAHELDPDAAIAARMSARFAAASAAVFPAAPAADSPSPASSNSPPSEAASAPSSDAPPKVSCDCKPQVPQG